MDYNITRLQSIELEARQSAAKWSDINSACPYPWGSPQAIIFKREFIAAREQIEQQERQDLAGLEVTELEPSDMLCQCNNELTVQELETMRCMACGKAVTA